MWRREYSFFSLTSLHPFISFSHSCQPHSPQQFGHTFQQVPTSTPPPHTSTAPVQQRGPPQQGGKISSSVWGRCVKMTRMCASQIRCPRMSCLNGTVLAYRCLLRIISACTYSLYFARTHTPAYAQKLLMPTATSVCITSCSVMLLAFGSDWPNVLNLQESGPNT